MYRLIRFCQIQLAKYSRNFLRFFQLGRFALLLVICAISQLYAEAVDSSYVEIVARAVYRNTTGRSDDTIAYLATVKSGIQLTLYIFNFSQGGYVILPNNNSLTPYAGFSDKGELDPGDPSKSNPEVNFMLEQYSALTAEAIQKEYSDTENQVIWAELHDLPPGQIMQAREQVLLPFIPMCQYSVDNSCRRALPIFPVDDEYDSVTQTHHYDHTVYDDDFARCNVGCVPLATTQIINYHHWISGIPLETLWDRRVVHTYMSSDDYDGNNLTYEGNVYQWPTDIYVDDDAATEYFPTHPWDFYNFNTLNTNLTALINDVWANNEELDYADPSGHPGDTWETGPYPLIKSSLFWAVGLACDASFSPGATASSLDNAATALRHRFGFRCDDVATGPSTPQEAAENVEWINELKAEINAGRPVLYKGDIDENGPGHAFVVCGFWDTGDTVLFYIDWDWHGDCDGWFNLSFLGLDDPEGFNYTINQKAVMGIEPAEFSIIGTLHTSSGDYVHTGMPTVTLTLPSGNTMSTRMKSVNNPLGPQEMVFLLDSAESGLYTFEVNHSGYYPEQFQLNINPQEEGRYIRIDQQITHHRERQLKGSIFGTVDNWHTGMLIPIQLYRVDTGEITTIEALVNTPTHSTQYAAWLPEEILDHTYNISFTLPGYYECTQYNVELTNSESETYIVCNFTAVHYPRLFEFPGAFIFNDIYSLQDAINNAGVLDGDTICVANNPTGVEYGSIQIGKSITLAGRYILTEDPLDISRTVFSGNDNSHVFAITASGGVTLNGLTITDSGTAYTGVWANSVSRTAIVTIDHCIVRSNGTGCRLQNAVIRNCIIADNSQFGVQTVASANEVSVLNSIVYDNTQGGITGPGSVTINYSDIQGGYAGFGNINQPPQFTNSAMNNFSLRWDSSGQSPCIGAGYDAALDIDLDGQMDDSELEGLRIDTPEIGPVPFTADCYRKYLFTNSGTTTNRYTWTCFNTLNTAQAHSVADFFSEQIIPLNHDLDQVQWLENGYPNPTVFEYDGIQWLYPDKLLDQYWGYKVLPFDGHDFTKWVHGFKPDYTHVYALAPMPNSEDVYWLGYCLPTVQRASDTFGTFLDHLYSIKTKNWSMVRVKPQAGAKWINCGVPVFTPGEAVEIKTFDHADSLYFTWAPSPTGTTTTTYASTSYFSYTEESDYTPLFVEFEENAVPLEAAVFVDGECKGAAVVDSSLVMIPAYLRGEEENAELEIQVYQGRRVSPIQGGKVFNATDGIFETATLRKQRAAGYYYVSFRSNPGLVVPPPTEIKLTSFPNPFNPVTTIRYSLPETGRVEIGIYNLRGQKVRTLVREEQSPGTRDVVWEGRDEHGHPVASGVYLVRLTAGSQALSHKLILLK